MFINKFYFNNRQREQNRFDKKKVLPCFSFLYSSCSLSAYLVRFLSLVSIQKVIENFLYIYLLRKIIKPQLETYETTAKSKLQQSPEIYSSGTTYE